MSNDNIKTYVAGADVAQFVAVYIDGADDEQVKTLAVGTGSTFAGITQQAALDTQPVQVVVNGITKARISGTVETGDLLTPTTDGALVKRTSGARAVAVYLGKPGSNYAAQDLTTGLAEDVYVLPVGVVNSTPLVLSFDVTSDPAARAANTTADLTLTATGVLATDTVVNVHAASLEAGLVLSNAYVSAADTVIVRLGNVTVGSIDAASQTFTVTVIRHANA